MSQEIAILLATAASIGFLHTILGPDHYFPFIVISKARKWSMKKTLWITMICGVGHVLSSVVIGIVGISLGIALHKLEYIESSRGEIAAWLLIAFGLTYFAWGLKKALRNKPHTHVHVHDDGKVHSHPHSHTDSHIHVHQTEGEKSITPWVLFTIFVFGPCESLIPILMYPASKENLIALILVTAVFALATIGTMITIVLVSLKGIKFFSLEKYEKYMHAAAGIVILVCGVSIKFLGL